MIETFKKLIGAKKGEVTKIKKNTQTTESVISDALTNAGDVSQVTLSQGERQALLERRHKTPWLILVLKYTSLVSFSVILIGAIFVRVETDAQNSYLGVLGLENTQVKHERLRKVNKILTEKTEALSTTLQDLEEKIATKKFGLFTKEIDEVSSWRRRWLDQEIPQAEKDENTKAEIQYGIINSFNAMIEYFEDAQYQTVFFAQREKALLGDNWQTCKAPNLSIAEKIKLKCPPSIRMNMKNELQLSNLSVNQSGLSVTLTANELLRKVFTLTTDFVTMMNSFDFLKNGQVTSFNRQKTSNGEELVTVNVRFDFQNLGETDLADENFEYFRVWDQQKK